MRSLLVLVTAWLMAVAGLGLSTAQTPTKIVPADGSDDDRFGTSVATAGNLLVLGSPHITSPFSSPAPGAVYLFERDGQLWSQVDKLQPATGMPNDRFGWSVTVSRNLLAVGAPMDDEQSTDAGAAYVFRRGPNGWIQETKLLSPNAPGDSFGLSVDLWDDTLVVGEPRASSPRAYVYRRSAEGTWSPEATLFPTPGGNPGEFGESVAIYQDQVLVGASEFQFPIGGPVGPIGAVYPFFREGDTWSAGTRIDSPTGFATGHFGFAIDLYDEYAVIGAYNETYSSEGMEGAAYVYQLSSPTQWSLYQTLVSSDQSPEDFFGQSVSIYQDRLLVGAPGEDVMGFPNVGAVYGFELQSGVWTGTFSFEPEEQEDKMLGESVAVETWACGGAPFDDEVVGLTFKHNVGSAYIHEWEP